MSFSYERYERQRRQPHSATSRRTALGYWLPLALTVTIATAGLAAWIWRERYESEDYESGSNDDDSVEPRPPQYAERRPDERPYAETQENRSAAEVESLLARMSGALRRTPSPQQILDSASRKVAAGVAAAGAAVGGALSSIREEYKNDYVDHSRWFEEAEAGRDNETRSPQGRRAVDTGTAVSGQSGTHGSSQNQRNVRRKTVAVVVSAESNNHIPDLQDNAYQAHASILSHLPAHLNPSTTQVLVLIYHPRLKAHPLSAEAEHADTTTSTYYHITNPTATPGEEPEPSSSKANINPSRSPALPAANAESAFFVALWHQAEAVVEKETHILPFTTSNGHIHMLRQLVPDFVYLQEILSNSSSDHDDGDVVTQISGWVGQVVVVVGEGGPGAYGGLVDTEDEGAAEGKGTEKRERWWQDAARVGLGKSVEIVDVARMGEDWARRVGGRE